MKKAKLGGAANESYYMGDLFGELTYTEEVDRPTPVRALVPGLLIAGIAAMAAAFLSLTYGFPLMLTGLLLGFSMSFVAQDNRTHAGFDFASRTLLRIGIILLGLQVTFAQVMALGIAPFGALLVVMIAALLGALLFAKLAGLSRESGILAGGATAICGISAALALYSVIGRDRLDQARFTITLVGVALASALALSTYPLIAETLGLDAIAAGYLVGASIHDVAQAIGGGYAISDAAGAQATIIKLARVALLAPVVALVALWLGEAGASGESRKPTWRRISMPWFIIAFLALVLVNSFVSMPGGVAENGLAVSKFLLLLAVTATAMRSRLSLLLEAGWRPLVPVITATLASFAMALFVATMLI